MKCTSRFQPDGPRRPIDAGIKYIVIEAPSPLTFPVSGGGTEVMSAFYNVQINDEAIPFTVSCPATVVRADSITCIATKAAGAVVTKWMWYSDTGSWTVQRMTNIDSLTWTGQIVGTGHVEVSGTINGHPFPVPARSNVIVVQPRNWTSMTSPTQISMVVPNTLSVTPRDTAGSLGRTLSRYLVRSDTPIGTVSDGGPNNGFVYYKGAPGRSVSAVSINASMDTLQPFYTLQYPTPVRRSR